MSYTIYIAQTLLGRYYVGQTKHLKKRVQEHGTSRGALFLKRKKSRIVYTEIYETLTQARSREQQLKGWSRAKKKALVRGDIGQLKALARSKSSRILKQ